MPHPAQPDHAIAETPPVLLGVDTHKDVHVAAVLTAVGVLVGSRSFPATARGYRLLLAWARGFGPVVRAGVECTGSYGAALTRHLRQAGVQVVEVNQPDKATRRRRGKTDAVDAEAAARAVLSERATAVPKAGDGHVEAMRVFKLARDSAVKSRTQAINQLKAVLVNVDPALRESLAGLGTKTLIRRCTDLAEPDTRDAAPAHTAAIYTLRLLARRIQQLTAEARDLEKRIRDAVTAHSPNCWNASVSALIAPPPCSSRPVTTPNDYAAKPPSPHSAVSAPSKPPPARPNGADSTGAATAKPTPPSTASCSAACAGTPAPATTWNDASPKAKPAEKRSAASNATSPARSTTSSTSEPADPKPSLTSQRRLDKHRGIYATHKHPAIIKWLEDHPRFHMHFTPTYSSWLNQVERWFGLLTDQKLRRGVHKSLRALENDIRDWIRTWNDNPRPFVWTKSADEILERLASYLERIPDAGR